MITFIEVKTYKNIASILLLSIYCAVVFHNVVPHIHTDNPAEKTQPLTAHKSHEHGHHHHDHDHHSHHENQEESSWIDYVLRLLGDVQHPDLGDDHFENFTAQSNHFDVALLDLKSIDYNPIYLFSYTSIELEKTQNHIGHPKILYEQHRACSSPLRGPPTIS